MKVLAIAQQKGGVGKSTLAVHLAAEAVRDGVSALVIELDKQGTASLWSSRRQDRPRVLKIESSQLAQQLKVHQDQDMQLVVLDMPGAHSASVTPAIKAADFVLIPARPHEIDIAASADTLAAVQRLDKTYAYCLTFTETTGGRAEAAREALEEAGHAVMAGEIGRRQVFADAVASGSTAFEIEPKGKAAREIKELWKSLKSKLEI